MMGIATTTIHAPFANFVIVTMTKTTPVVAAPTPLMMARASPSRSAVLLNHRRTMPVCESVKAVNTPTT